MAHISSNVDVPDGWASGADAGVGLFAHGHAARDHGRILHDSCLFEKRGCQKRQRCRFSKFRHAKMCHFHVAPVYSILLGLSWLVYDWVWGVFSQGRALGLVTFLLDTTRCFRLHRVLERSGFDLGGFSSSEGLTLLCKHQAHSIDI